MYGTWCKAQFISEKLMVKMENNGRQHKLGHYVQARPQIAETLLEVFDVDRAADHGDPWILSYCCHHAIPNIVSWGIVPTCMVSARGPPGRVAPPGRHHICGFNRRLGLSQNLPRLSSRYGNSNLSQLCFYDFVET